MKRVLASWAMVFVLGVGVAAWGAEPAAGQQVETRLALKDGKAVEFLLYLPKDYGQGEKRWPLMLFLHGRGESDGPLSVVKKWGPPQRLSLGEHFPYIIASPQCPRSSSWARDDQQAVLVSLLDHLEKTYRVDQDRIYLTGLSMGGFGSWRLATDHPERFAAVAPVCGAGDPLKASSLKNLPVWAWHGTEDTAVPFQRSLDMVEAIKNAGGSLVKFTTLEGIGHFSWQAAYGSNDLYEWLDKQTASANKKRTAGE